MQQIYCSKHHSLRQLFQKNPSITRTYMCCMHLLDSELLHANWHSPFNHQHAVACFRVSPVQLTFAGTTAPCTTGVDFSCRQCSCMHQICSQQCQLGQNPCRLANKFIANTALRPALASNSVDTSCMSPSMLLFMRQVKTEFQASLFSNTSYHHRCTVQLQYRVTQHAPSSRLVQRLQSPVQQY